MAAGGDFGLRDSGGAGGKPVDQQENRHWINAFGEVCQGKRSHLAGDPL